MIFVDIYVLICGFVFNGDVFIFIVIWFFFVLDVISYGYIGY